MLCRWLFRWRDRRLPGWNLFTCGRIWYILQITTRDIFFVLIIELPWWRWHLGGRIISHVMQPAMPACKKSNETIVCMQSVIWQALVDHGERCYSFTILCYQYATGVGCICGSCSLIIRLGLSTEDYMESVYHRGSCFVNVSQKKAMHYVHTHNTVTATLHSHIYPHDTRGHENNHTPQVHTQSIQVQLHVYTTCNHTQYGWCFTHRQTRMVFHPQTNTPSRYCICLYRCRLE